MKILPLLAVLVLATPAFLVAQPTATGSISGRILTSGGEPLNHALIRIVGTPRGGYSRADGTFLLSRVPVGTWELWVVYVGMKEQRRLVTVVQDSMTAVDSLSLTPVAMVPCFPANSPPTHRPDIGGGTIRRYTRDEMLRVGIYERVLR